MEEIKPKDRKKFSNLLNDKFDLVWYLNITLSQVIELLEKGNVEMAIGFLKNAKMAIKQGYPEVLQESEKEVVA